MGDRIFSPSSGFELGEFCWLEPFKQEGQEMELTATGRGLVVREVNPNVPLVPWTDSITRFNLVSERLTLLILRDGHLEIPCCLQIRFIVVGQTVKQESYSE